MRFRLIVDRWRWRGMREFLRRNRLVGALSVEQRVNDYLAVADAFGLTWPRDETRCMRFFSVSASPISLW